MNNNELKDFINAPERNLTFNKLGGVNGLKEIKGELLEFTLSDCEVSLIDEKTHINEFDQDSYNMLIAINEFKAERQNQIDNATVEISTGKSFDADEKSIQRLSASVVSHLSKPDDYIIEWSTADVGTGVMVECTKAEITEALALAVKQATEITRIN